ncbi:chitin-binding protein [Kitasatospora herbaricolor]|uniref:lytic polysaccharide monooxygenase auxiliary activity family 9 protein n=1 Tax=Kitasatospora herbaricolor TaxID=68217 RepID=UPI001748F415|nr:lytic polysaccharide monooxygenase [Kitasatospora herbaricolor]MDQ0311979.1 chitin-binding protein [Kitasatospora herbaricolor]GGU97609.1 chitin-binding protein [Kitasatospora herbaricolor]
MPLHRRALALGVVGSTVLLTALTSAGTAGAHGSMSNPVSRVAACFAEGPEHPQSQVCKDLVAQSGTQPLYDWNEVNIANANGQHQALIPDGKLCSANRDKYKALDMARTDWPATAVAAGPYNFKFRVTAAHIGLMTVYITKVGYDPTKPLKWSDLDPTPVAQTQVTRTATDGYYNFTGTLPQRTGRQLLYMTWQRSDSPEAFYSCSDVDFAAAQPKLAAAPAAPSDQQIAAAAAKSTVDHYGHGGDTAPEAPAVQAQAAAVGGTSQAGPLMLAGAVAVGAGWGALVLRRRRADAARDAA